MKKSILVIALAMMFAVVQGYAQRSTDSRSTRVTTTTRTTTLPATVTTRTTTRPQVTTRTSSSRPQVTTTRTSSSRPQVTTTRTTTVTRSSRPVEMPSVRPQNTGRRPVEMPQVRPQNTGRRPVEMPKVDGRGGSHNNRPTPPPRPHHGEHKPSAPHFGHHHNHHHHHCIFDAWRWVSFLGYTQRFICHSYYADRFFDSHLGVFVYGSLENPTKIEVNGVYFYRYNDFVAVHGAKVKSYSVLENRHIVYEIGYNKVELITGNGYATLFIYDEYGNSSTYYL